MIICSTTNLFLLYFSCIRADTNYIMWGKFVLELLHGLVLSATGDLQLCLVTVMLPSAPSCIILLALAIMQPK